MNGKLLFLPQTVIVIVSFGLFFLILTPAVSQIQEGVEDERVALVLAGGGALGFAHVGAIQAIEEAGIDIDFIVGTSIGSIVGALYAAGYSVADMRGIVTESNWQDLLFDRADRRQIDFIRRISQHNFITNFSFSENSNPTHAGVSQGQHVVEFLDMLLEAFPEEFDFDEMPRKFRAVAADLVTGEEVVFKDGDLKTVIRASMSIPGIFAPVMYRERLLIDGGWVNNVPVKVARDSGYDRIITVTLGGTTSNQNNLGTIKAVATQSSRILVLKGDQEKLHLSNIIISPDLDGFTPVDFERGEELMALGYRAALENLHELQAMARDQQGGSTRPSPIPPEKIIIKDIYISSKITPAPEKINALKSTISGSHSPQEIRNTVYELFDTGDYLRAWYQLERNPESDEMTLRLDAEPYPMPEAVLGLNFTLEGQLLENVISKTAGMISYTHRLGNSGKSVWSIESTIAQSNSLRISILSQLFPGFIGGSSLYFLQDPYYFYEDNKVLSVYERRRLGASLSAGLTLGKASLFSLEGFIENGASERQVGEAILPADYENRLGLKGLFMLDTLDRSITPRRGNELNLKGETALDNDGELHTFGYDFSWAGYRSFGDRRVIRMRGELKGSLKIPSSPVFQPNTGGIGKLFGYYPQELREDNLGIVGIDLRFRVLSLPLGLGEEVYFQLSANGAYLWPGEFFKEYETGTHYSGLGAGLVANTLLGEFHLHLGISEKGRMASYIAFSRGIE